MLSLSPLTCENSLALSYEGWALSEKIIIKVCDNLYHRQLSQQGTAVRLGPNPWQGRITGQTYDSYDQSTAMRTREAAGSAIIWYVLQKSKQKTLWEICCCPSTLARGEIACLISGNEWTNWESNQCCCCNKLYMKAGLGCAFARFIKVVVQNKIIVQI